MSLDPDAIRAIRDLYGKAKEHIENDWACCSGHRLGTTVPGLLADIDRLTGHSTTLNTISYRMAEALGDVQAGESVMADPTELADRLLAELERLRANQLPEGGTWTTETRHRNSTGGELVTGWQDFQPDEPATECVEYGCEQRRTYRWTGPAEPIAAPSTDPVEPVAAGVESKD